jgi:crossover junction endodeoxyribonuclease RuvC
MPVPDGLIVAGIDPSSYRNCGWAVVGLEDDKPVLLAKYTQIFEGGPEDLGRFDLVYEEFQSIVDAHGPTVLALERSMGGGMKFVRNNLSETVGVVKLCCYRNNVEVVEISPAHMKKVIAGHGRAKKKHIKANVKAAFGLGRGAGSEHELDAAGMALCHLIDLGWQGYKVEVPYQAV